MIKRAFSEIVDAGRRFSPPANAGLFLWYSAIVFGLSGLTKLVSLSSRALILNQTDNLLPVRNRTLFIVLGLVELGVAVALRCKLKVQRKMFIVFLLSANVLFYRIALRVLGAGASCPCLGRATDWWPWLANNEDWLLPVILVSMLIAAGYFLLNGYSTREEMRQ